MFHSRSSSKTRRKSDRDQDASELCEQMNGSSFTISSNGLLPIPRIHVDRSASQSESSWTSNEGQEPRKLSDSETRKSSVSSNTSAHSASVTPVRSQRPSRTSDASGVSDSGSSRSRKYWGEDASEDAVYNVYLKKITYSGHTDMSNGFGDLLTPNVDEVDSGPRSGFGKDVFRRKSTGKSPKKKHSTSDEVGSGETMLSHVRN